MPKGSIRSFFDNDVQESSPHARSQVSLDPSSSIHSAPSRTTTLFSAVKLPTLRRSDTSNESFINLKTPLLELELSSPSFLNAALRDARNGQTFYTVKTLGNASAIVRSGYDGDLVKAAEFRWPKIPTGRKGNMDTDGVVITMRGARWKGTETLLRPGSFLSSPRKFDIPNYSQSLKWKQSGNSYICNTSSVKGPIAIFQCSVGSAPARLLVYETLRDKHGERSMRTIQGVSILLLDFLLVTSLLLTTDVQEWRKFDANTSQIAASNYANGHKNKVPAGPSSATTSWADFVIVDLPPNVSTTEVPSDARSPTPTSPTMPKFIYTDSIYSDVTSVGRHNSVSSLVSANNDKVSPPTRPLSPSTESMFYPLANASAPSHTYIDPSFYRGEDAPPVPLIPKQLHHLNSEDKRILSSRPLTSSSTTSSLRQRRELPLAPGQLHIGRIVSSPSPSSSFVGSDDLSFSPLDVASPVSLSKSRSISRPLPRPPPLSPLLDDSDGETPALRTVRSQTRLDRRTSQRPQRSLPPTPIPSVSGRQLPRQPKKFSQEDLSQWVHMLTSPRGLPTIPLPGASMFDAPPPAYNAIDHADAAQVSISSPSPSDHLGS